MNFDKAPKGKEVNAWVDYQYYLEDIIEDNMRSYENMFRKRVLNSLAVIDTIERLQEIGLPDGEDEEDSGRLLKTAFNTAKEVQRNLQIALHRRKVWEIPLSKGDYPPVESTRIISHTDPHNKGLYVVEIIVEKGYTYKNLVLRKASVIVTTQSKEI